MPQSFSFFSRAPEGSDLLKITSYLMYQILHLPLNHTCALTLKQESMFEAGNHILHIVHVLYILHILLKVLKRSTYRQVSEIFLESQYQEMIRATCQAVKGQLTVDYRRLLSEHQEPQKSSFKIEMSLCRDNLYSESLFVILLQLLKSKCEAGHTIFVIIIV